MGFSFRAMWQNKCPRCREGDIFIKPLNLSKPLDMPHSCSNCGQLTEPEPGFYYGAMFLSYIIGSWLVLLPTLFLVFYLGMNVEKAMLVAIIWGLIMYLKLMRGSRSLWLHMMVKYNAGLAKKLENSKVDHQKEWKPRQYSN